MNTRIGRNLLVLVVLAASAPVRAGAAEQEHVLFTEVFKGKLADGWSLVREDAKGWRLDQGALVIRTSTGGLWLKDNNTQNIFLRTPPQTKDAPLIIEVFVENEPTNAYEHAGLVWYGDDDNYVILVKEKVGDRQLVQLVPEYEGRPKVGFAEKAYQGKGVWLRMEVFGGKVRGQFRATEKDAWQTLGECDLPSKGEPRLGLLTGYAPKNMEHEARFRSFRILQGKK
jgi:regulation of enolase protein 1 (concanavalin A-like superfamily)